MGGPDAGALRCPLGGKGTSDGPGKGAGGSQPNHAAAQRCVRDAPDGFGACGLTDSEARTYGPGMLWDGISARITGRCMLPGVHCAQGLSGRH